MMATFISTLLHSKLPDIAEVELFLFEHCNLRCVHCFQDHEARVGMSRAEIFSKAAITANFIKQNPLKKFVLNVMGGELFQEQLLKEFLPIYSEFIELVVAEAEAAGKEVTFNFVTNLLCADISFIDWLEKHDLAVSTSYDPTGRFNSTNLEVFKRNVELLGDRIALVTGVATKPNIDAVMRGDDYFSYLYSRFPFYWDQLTPGPTVPAGLMPKQSELLAFLKFLIDHYPSCLNVQAYVDRHDRPISCPSMNKLLVEADDSTSSCRIKKHKEHPVIFLSPVKDANDDLIQNFMQKYDCLACEYFKSCTFSCFVRHDWKQLVDDVGTCIYKLAFDHAAKRDKYDVEAEKTWQS